MINTLYKVTLRHINENKEVTEIEMRSSITRCQITNWISNDMQCLTSGQKIDVQIELQQK